MYPSKDIVKVLGFADTSADNTKVNSTKKLRLKSLTKTVYEATIREKIKEKDAMSRRLNEMKKQKKWRDYDNLLKDYCKVHNKVRSLS